MGLRICSRRHISLVAQTQNQVTSARSVLGGNSYRRRGSRGRGQQLSDFICLQRFVSGPGAHTKYTQLHQFFHSCVPSCFSHVRFCDPMDCSPPDSSVGVSRQEYWSGLPCPPPGDLPNPGTEPVFSASHALPGRCFTTQPPGKPQSK